MTNGRRRLLTIAVLLAWVTCSPGEGSVVAPSLHQDSSTGAPQRQPLDKTQNSHDLQNAVERHDQHPGLNFETAGEGGRGSEGSASDLEPGSSPRVENRRVGVGVDVGVSAGSDVLLSLTCRNSYPIVTWSPWEHLAEPYKEAFLTATAGRDAADEDGVFVWTLPEENGAVFEGR